MWEWTMMRVAMTVVRMMGMVRARMMMVIVSTTHVVGKFSPQCVAAEATAGHCSILRRSKPFVMAMAMLLLIAMAMVMVINVAMVMVMKYIKCIQLCFYLYGMENYEQDVDYDSEDYDGLNSDDQSLELG